MVSKTDLLHTYMFQTNPFDLFETFFGASMGGFSGMDQGSFRTRRRAAMRGEDIRLVLTFDSILFMENRILQL